MGDFNKALKDVAEQFHPDRILIEPSGVGKLSDVIVAVENTAAEAPDLKLNSFVTVADASKVKVYMKNFGEFYNNQIESAGTIVLSRTQKLSQEKLEAAVALLREKNDTAAVITTPWDQLDGKAILNVIEGVSMHDQLLELVKAAHAHHHEHEHDHDHEGHEHHHDHGEESCSCGHDHGHEHHHHDHGEGCSCGHEHHHHHGDAEEMFDSWGKETPKAFSRADIETILEALDDGKCGEVLRAKGIVPDGEGGWLEFDFVPDEYEVRQSKADYTGRLCVIGVGLKEDKLAQLFGL